MLRRIGGYAHTWDRESGNQLQERDTFTCNHCHYQTHVKAFCPPEDMGGYCSVCDSLICKMCNYKRSLGKPCTPMLEKVQRLETHLERGGVFRDVLTFNDEDNTRRG